MLATTVQPPPTKCAAGRPGKLSRAGSSRRLVPAANQLARVGDGRSPPRRTLHRGVRSSPTATHVADAGDTLRQYSRRAPTTHCDDVDVAGCRFRAEAAAYITGACARVAVPPRVGSSHVRFDRARPTTTTDGRRSPRKSRLEIRRRLGRRRSIRRSGTLASPDWPASAGPFWHRLYTAPCSCCSCSWHLLERREIDMTARLDRELSG